MAGIDHARIELLVLDVDGVLTDGRIAFTDDGREVLSFHVRDATGMKYWKRAGGRLALISGRASRAVVHQADELDVDAVRLGAKDKLSVYLDVLAELAASPEGVAVVGDDLTDLPLFRHCAFAVAVADAVEEVRQAAAWVTARPGGRGAVREVIEMILKQAGKWAGIMARYRREEGAPTP